ncbi:DUF4139 domain-containing protein [Parerythrobacter aestuarii]|uniref:DUF4139 domain-containing protein n=1 Tax=Parerythrobacter aestuarii TaxID=3020909 RepID=UPI0024DE3B90|nr:hypothetical protein [Parerythrobacter aestuarii]
MRRLASFLLAAAAVTLPAHPALARETVDASDPQGLSVTIYRDPSRGEYQAMNPGWPRGFAMISETRSVTLPPGESTIRFTGVAEGMVAVSAIVTGLPGGTIEKNRDADLLSPAALVDGTLGNRVRITRTNPGTGAQTSEQAIVRTRADGGIVLQTQDGYEAVRCSGLPEGLAFDRVPAGLSAKPVFSINTNSDSGGTFTVTLTYLAWGFDWEAHYVGTLDEGGARGKVRMRLMSWLTLLNDNGQSFPDAELMAVAGTLNIESNFEQLSDPPTARPLRLTCYPIGSTARGSPVPNYDPRYPPPPPPPPMAPMMESAMADGIMVTGARMQQKSVVGMVAQEEQLGDLKLYRVPEAITVNAKGLKQVAFLDKDKVEGEYVYTLRCDPWNLPNRFEMQEWSPQPADIVFETVNDEEHGLGVALPTGGLTLFEPSAFGDQLVAENRLRDYAEGQDVEIDLGQSSMVFGACGRELEERPADRLGEWVTVGARLSNARNGSVRMRLLLGSTAQWEIRQGRRALKTKDGDFILELKLRPGEEREVRWDVRMPATGEGDA